MDRTSNIVITGTTGSGKTTLARAVAARTGRVLVDLDDLYWLPEWQERTTDDFRARVQAALDEAAAAGHAWVVAGNYSSVQDIVWPRAQIMAGLDYPAPLVFWRLLRRTLGRVAGGTPVCNGNRETFRRAFFSRDSIFVWFFKTCRTRRQKLAALIDNPAACPHMRLLRFTSPHKAHQWLHRLT